MQGNRFRGRKRRPPPSAWLDEWKWSGVTRPTRKVVKVKLQDTTNVIRARLMKEADRWSSKEEGCQWIFVKVVGKSSLNRAINDFLRNSWGICSWFHIQQMSHLRSRLGWRIQKIMAGFWGANGTGSKKVLFIIRGWMTWKDCNFKAYSSLPIKIVLPVLGPNLWSKKALCTITSTLGKPIGAQRLVNP